MDELTKLPDDILSYLLSYLTVRDAVKVRLSSTRLKSVPDCRSVLQFDANTVLGRDSPRRTPTPSDEFEFVKVVDQFMQILRTHKISALKLKFGLENKYESHIDGWIARVTDAKVEDLDLDFSFFMKDKIKEYVFPCHLLAEKESVLKRLRLTCCALALKPDACTSWLHNLTMIELINVSLSLSEMKLIMSSSLNLESLSFLNCKLGKKLCFQHHSLKKLVVMERCVHVELCCPHLEIFEFIGFTDFIFSNVPLLREVSLRGYSKLGFYSYPFSRLAKDVPQLQALSWRVYDEVLPLPPSATMFCLKRLDLFVEIPPVFDLLSITHILYACPFLATLNLKLYFFRHSDEQLKRQYEDRPHFHLKELRIEGPWPKISMLGLTEYLLKNGVSLRQVIIVVGKGKSSVTDHPKFTMLQNINPAVDMIVI